ncbi:MAG TPA: hypothetical protein DEQ61_19940 [Streptomyces sp.]|nr:hypothetical protein [Streptomyces sp.]
MRPPSGTPLAFIYDRCATDRKVILRLRLDACRAQAEELGWEIAGEWVDDGDNALTNDRRPAFDSMCDVMAEYGRARLVLCLVHDWDRIARDGIASSVLRRRVMLAGGHCETASGESDDHAPGALATPSVRVP